MTTLLNEVEIETARRKWELSKLSTGELRDELNRREEVNHYEHKEEVDATGDMPYCLKCEVAIGG